MQDKEEPEGCGSPVETSAQQKHRPSRKARLCCRLLRAMTQCCGNQTEKDQSVLLNFSISPIAYFRYLFRYAFGEEQWDCENFKNVFKKAEGAFFPSAFAFVRV